MNFRYDINGLRAIAVIAVVLFHFNPAWVPGGFAGVDVFFVISGFLMTGVIFRGLETNNFNLFKFYVARANRIIPALSVLCLVLLVFGWFYLTPLDYRALGKHVASSMGFLSNVIYWKESGYFDAASHEKWLLHTWSLSAEWQFYILYPVVLLALKKLLSLENLKRLIVIGTILGFIFCVIVTIKWPNPAYYLLPTRAWEMMMGGVAFLYPWDSSKSRKKIVEVTGLALILGSYAFVSSSTPWPGYFALLPVLGTYLMIVSNQQSSVITNNILFQFLGKWSYSIYLWHWPIVVCGYYFDIQGWALYGILLSVILGFISFNFVEGFKFKSFERLFDVFKIIPVYLTLILGVMGTITYVSYGYSERYGDGILIANKEANNKNKYQENCFRGAGTDFNKCKFGSGDVSLILIGDSHSDAVLTSVIDAMPLNKSVLFMGYSGCPVVKDAQRIKQRNDENLLCREYNNWVYDEIDKYDINIPVIIVNRITHYVFGFLEHETEYKSPSLSSVITFEEDTETIVTGVPEQLVLDFEGKFKETIMSLTAEGRRVFYVMPIPEMEFNVPSEEVNRIIKGLSRVRISMSDYNKRHGHIIDLIKSIASSNDNFKLLDTVPYLCSEQYCFGSDDKHRPFYFDDDHLSEYGNRRLVPMFKSVMVHLP